MTGFRPGPTGQILTQRSFVENAFGRGVGSFEAFYESVIGGVEQSFGLGTAIRDFSLPEGAPTAPAVRPPPLPDLSGMTPEEERAAVLDWSLQGPEVESEEAFEARREEAGGISEEEYRASRFYRQGIAWDPAMTMERAAAQAAWYDAARYRASLLENSDTFAVQTIGDLLGQAVDPINYIPVLGAGARALAVTRLGMIGGRAAVGAADAALNTAIAGAATADLRARFGDDVSWQAFLLEVGGAAVIGGLFGGASGVLGSRAAAAAAVRNAAEVRAVLNDAVGGILTQGEVRLSPASAEALARIGEREVSTAERRLRRSLLDSTAAVTDPLAPPFDARALPASFTDDWRQAIEAEARAASPGLFQRLDRLNAEARAFDEEIATLRQQLAARDDIDAIEALDPDTAGRLRAIQEDLARPALPRRRRMALEAEEATIRETLGRKKTRQQVRQAARDATAPVEARIAELQRQRDRMESYRARVAGDVARRVARIEQRQEALRRLRDISRPPPEPPRPERAQAEAAVASRVKPAAEPRPEEEAGLDPESGEAYEIAELEQLAAEGRLDAEMKRRFDEATELVVQAEAYGKAIRAVATCLMR